MKNVKSSFGSQFLPLYQQEMSAGPFDLSTVISVLFFAAFWMSLSLFPLYWVMTRPVTIGVTLFMPVGFFWIMAVCGFCALSMVPGFSTTAPGFKSFEFIFTRAVDRRLHYRAKAASLYTLVCVPLLIGIVISFFPSKLALFQMAGKPPELIENYRNVFPSSMLVGNDLHIPGGTIFFAVWQLWMAFAAASLLMAYYVFVPARFSTNYSLLVAYAFLPPLLGFILMFVSISNRMPHFAESFFLLFSAAPWLWFLILIPLAAIIQMGCERQFARFEIF